MGLPAEIRYHILDYLIQLDREAIDDNRFASPFLRFHHPKEGIINVEFDNIRSRITSKRNYRFPRLGYPIFQGLSRTCVALLRANKQLYADCCHAIYACNTFLIIHDNALLYFGAKVFLGKPMLKSLTLNIPFTIETWRLFEFPEYLKVINETFCALETFKVVETTNDSRIWLEKRRYMLMLVGYIALRHPRLKHAKWNAWKVDERVEVGLDIDDILDCGVELDISITLNSRNSTDIQVSHGP